MFVSVSTSLKDMSLYSPSTVFFSFSLGEVVCSLKREISPSTGEPLVVGEHFFNFIVYGVRVKTPGLFVLPVGAKAL